MGYSIDAITDGCYKGTTCLINKFGIKDENLLNRIEGDIAFAKATELEANPLLLGFDFEHYKAIHKFLFEEIYDWAGTPRKINISKKGTKFVPADQIPAAADAIFGRLKKKNCFKDQNKKDFVDDITDFYFSTNMLHPFREGNGRTQRIFISQLIRYCGYSFNFFDFDPDELLIATIQSSNGDNTLLKNMFFEKISETDVR